MLDVNDRVDVPVTNLKEHFCLWGNHKNAHNPRRQWRSQPKNLGGAKSFGAGKMLDFWRITLFCLEKRLSRHKMTIFSRNFLGGMAALAPLPTPIHEGIYTVIKLPRNGNCKTKKLIKNNSGFGS